MAVLFTRRDWSRTCLTCRLKSVDWAGRSPWALFLMNWQIKLNLTSSVSFTSLYPKRDRICSRSEAYYPYFESLHKVRVVELHLHELLVTGRTGFAPSLSSCVPVFGIPQYNLLHSFQWHKCLQTWSCLRRLTG